MPQTDHLAGVAAFVAAARHHSFTEAALALGVTKSAVGKSVSRLEARLGTKLMHRSTRGLTLTAEGEAYLAIAQRALDDIAAAETYLITGQSAVAGQLRVDAPAAWGREVLLPILLEIAQAHPDLRLSISFADRLIDPISAQVDLVIRFGETGDTAGLITRKLAQQRAPLVAAPGYLARHGIPRTPDDLHAHACITGIRHQVPIGFRLAGVAQRFAIRPAHEIGDGAAVVQAAIAGLGIAQMPLSLVAAALADGRLVEVLPEHGTAVVGIFALWPRTRHLAARVRHVVDVLAARGQAGLL